MLLKWYYKIGIIKVVPIICLPKNEIVSIKTRHLNPKKKGVYHRFCICPNTITFPIIERKGKAKKRWLRMI